ncbi:MAG: hypothetical protein ABRQ25_17030 [Clostridiaceae bacterium]
MIVHIRKKCACLWSWQKNMSTANKIFILSIAVNAFLFYMILNGGPIRFESNDDVVMMDMASGAGVTAPGHFLVFINVIYGYGLQFLYSLFPGISWYGIVFIILLYIGWTSILFALLMMKNKVLSLIFYGAVFLVFGVGSLVLLQFTKVSFILGIGGMILFLKAYSGKSENVRLYKVCFIISVILIFLSSLIRSKVVYSVFAQSSLLIAYLVLRSIRVAEIKEKLHEKRIGKFAGYLYSKLDKSVMVFCVSCIFVCFTGSAIDNIVVSNNESWNKYYQYNLVRGAIHDHPLIDISSEKGKEVLANAGWSENDLNSFLKWNFFDEEKYSKEKLEYIRDNLVRKYSMKELKDKLKDKVKNLDVSIKFMSIIIIIYTLLLTNLKRILLIAGQASIMAALVIYLELISRAPDRVVYPMILLLFLLSWMTIYEYGDSYEYSLYNRIRKSIKLIPSRNAVSILCLMFLTAVTFRIGLTDLRILHKEIQDSRDKLYYLIDSVTPEKHYLMQAYSFKPQSLDPLVYPEKFYKLQYFLAGWTTQSPFTNKVMEKYGVNNFYLDCSDNDDIRILTNSYNNLDFLIKYIKENYNKSVYINLIKIIYYQDNKDTPIAIEVSIKSAS